MKGIYSKFFSLESNPFGETPDPDFYYASLQHSTAFSALMTAIRSGKGFSLLTGEVGTGKTLMGRLLLSACTANTNTALVLYPKFTEVELLQVICDEFEIPGDTQGFQTTKAYIDHINAFLFQTAQAGKRSLLLIDEAQLLSPEALETIRLLTNLETQKQKLLQIVLIGQEELNDVLSQKNLRQLKQRISVWAQLKGLDLLETQKYIRTRIESGGNGNFVRFDPEAIKVIHSLTNGIPRRINQVCESLIQSAEAQKVRLLDREFVVQGLNLKSKNRLSFFSKRSGR